MSVSGWLKNINEMEYVEKYKSWDKSKDGKYACIIMELIHGVDKSSHNMASIIDDIAKGNFYYRDWTKDGLPFVKDNEIYWCGFWFQHFEDAKKFTAMFGGKASWTEDFEEFQKCCIEKRETP